MKIGDSPAVKFVTSTAQYMAAGYEPSSNSQNPVQASSGTQMFRVDVQVLLSSQAPAADLAMILMVVPTSSAGADGLAATVNGAVVTLPPASTSAPTNVTTDAAGLLVVEIQGNQQASLLQLMLVDPDPDAAPFWTTTLIAPDFGNLTTFSNLQGGDIQGTAAVCYDQSALITNDQLDTDAIAQGVRNTIGNVTTSKAQNLLRPQPMRQVRRDQLDASAAGRPWKPGAVSAFTLDLQGGVTFTPSVSDAVWGPADSITGSIDDFFKHVYKDGKKVLKLALQEAVEAGQAVVKALIDGVEESLSFVVSSVEDAAASWSPSTTPRTRSTGATRTTVPTSATTTRAVQRLPC